MEHDGITETPTLDSFLMIGQSNMAGRGELAGEEEIRHPLCYMLRMGRWQKMSEPVNTDRAIFNARIRSGASLAAPFAVAYATHFERKVGLIPCADGGTHIEQWMPGGLLFDHAVMQAKLAMRTSALRGILWHQGESDCGVDERYAAYPARFRTFFDALLEELGCPDLPILAGELSPAITREWNAAGRAKEFNANLAEWARHYPHMAVVSADGLTLKEDGIHFDTPSLRVFGQRYFDAYLSLCEGEAKQ